MNDDKATRALRRTSAAYGCVRQAGRAAVDAIAIGSSDERVMRAVQRLRQAEAYLSDAGILLADALGDPQSAARFRDAG